MITIPVGSGMYQAVLQGQGIALADNGQLQIIGAGTPVQLAAAAPSSAAGAQLQHVVKMETQEAQTAASAAAHQAVTVNDATGAALSLAALQQGGVYHHPPQQQVRLLENQCVHRTQLKFQVDIRESV